MNIHGYEIPDAIAGTAIGAFIGASVSLVGMFFNDWRNTARLKLQNAHSEKVASEARDHVLKKEILLSLPGAMNKFQSELGGLTSAASLDAIQREFVEFNTALSKVSVVASTDTAALATELSAFFSTIYLDSLPMWAKVHDLHDTFQTSVKNLNDSNERFKAANLEHTEALKDAANDPERNAGLLAHCQRKVELAKAQSAERIAEMNAALKSYLDAQDGLTHDLIAIVENADQHTIPMLIAVRAELGVATDEDKLRKVFREQKAAVLNSLQRTMEHTRKIAEGEL